mgnify:CR=1 FL=1
MILVSVATLDGLSAVMRIREKQNIPIIVLSAKSEETDKVLGLSMGADDYVAKPYNPQELAARVKSQLRRYTSLGDIHAGSAPALPTPWTKYPAPEDRHMPSTPHSLLFSTECRWLLQSLCRRLLPIHAARVKSQLRRYTSLGDIHAGSRAGEIRNGRLLYNTEEKILYADGEPVRLTATAISVCRMV